MVTADVDLELRQQLKEAGNQLSNPPEPVDELLHLLDQTEKLLGMVDQSPDKLMQEALNGPIKALVDERLLKHSNMDVKVSVANCICEITRVTAPEAPYSDEEMKGYFQLVVSSFEDLWDESSRSYSKRLSILDIVYKVRSSLIMLDLECDALIEEMFKHFLKSVRDHHRDKGFSLMKNIMSLVIEESEEISDDLLNTLLASVKIDSEGVLPVARKLGEEVIENSADKLRPYLNQAVKRLNDSLDNYSQVLMYVCEGTSNPNKRNDQSVSVLHKTDETKLAPAYDNSVQVISNGEMGNDNDEGSDKELKKPEEAIDHPNANMTSPVEKSTIIESKLVPTSNQTANKSAEPSDSADRTNVESEIMDHPLKNGSPLKESETVNVGPVSHGTGTITKGVRSKKKSSGQTATPSTNVVLTKAPEGSSDAEMKSPKRVRKKTSKAEDNNKRSVTSGSDVKLAEKVPEEMSDAEMISPKRARTKTLKAEVNKTSVTNGSDVEPGPSEKVLEVTSDLETISSKRARKKTPKVDETKKILSKKKSGKKVDTIDSGSKAVESLTKEAGGTDEVDSGSKMVKSPGKNVGGKRPVSKKGKSNDTKTEGGDSKSKKSKQGEKKVDTANKEEQTATKALVKPIEDIGNKDEETDSEATIVKVSENVDEQSDSDDKPIKLSAQKGNKNSSEVKSKKPVVKSSSMKKGGKTVEEKMQAKPVSDDDDDDGMDMDIPLKSALKTATKGGGKLLAKQASSSKRKRSVSKSNVAGTVKYDGSLIGKLVKVWWPDDEMYYEGVVASFDATEKKHKVLYLDGEEEILNLKDEKWEIIQEYSVQNEENAAQVEAQNTDVVPESPVKKKAKKTSGPSAQRSGLGPASKSGGGNKGEGKVGNKSKAVMNSNEFEKTKEDEQKSPTDPKTSQEPLVYKSKGRKNKSKAVEDEPKDDKDAAEEPVSVEKSTGPKIGSKSGQKRKKT